MLYLVYFNEVKRILLKIPGSIYLLESITRIPIQILYVDGHFENYATAGTLILSSGRLWLASYKEVPPKVKSYLWYHVPRIYRTIKNSFNFSGCETEFESSSYSSHGSAKTVPVFKCQKISMTWLSISPLQRVSLDTGWRRSNRVCSVLGKSLDIASDESKKNRREKEIRDFTTYWRF